MPGDDLSTGYQSVAGGVGRVEYTRYGDEVRGGCGEFIVTESATARHGP